MEFARTFWASVLFIGGAAFLLWLFKPGVGDAPSNWSRIVNHFFQPATPAESDLSSSRNGERSSFPNAGNSRSYAMEQGWEQAGTEGGNLVPMAVRLLANFSDEEILAVLSLLPNEDGNDFRYADTRVAKFVGGRVEDRQVQVRDVRGKEEAEKTTKPARVIAMRHMGVERQVAVE